MQDCEHGAAQPREPKEARARSCSRSRGDRNGAPARGLDRARLQGSSAGAGGAPWRLGMARSTSSRTSRRGSDGDCVAATVAWLRQEGKRGERETARIPGGGGVAQRWSSRRPWVSAPRFVEEARRWLDLAGEENEEDLDREGCRDWFGMESEEVSGGGGIDPSELGIWSRLA